MKAPVDERKAEKERKKWDAAEKRATAEDILDGKLDYQDVLRRYKLQPYQLQAWIGQAAMARVAKQFPAGQRRMRQALLEHKAASQGAFPIEDVMAFARWYAEHKPEREP